MIRKMGGKHKNVNMPSLQNEEVATSNEEKAEC